MGRSVHRAVDQEIWTKARTAARRSMGRCVQRRLPGRDRRGTSGWRRRRCRNLDRQRPRLHRRGRASRIRRSRRRRSQRHTDCRTRRLTDALRPDAHVAELRDRGVVRGRSRASPAYRRQGDARVPADFFGAGTRSSAVRRISRRRADCRRYRSSAQRPCRRRFSQRAHSNCRPRLARSRSAARISRRRVSDAPCARAARLAARSAAISGPREVSFRTVYRAPLVRQSGHAGKNSGVARSLSRSSRLDRQYRRRSHRARAVVAGRGDRAHQFFLRDALARPVHRAQVRKRAHHKPARHGAALRNSREQPAHGRMPSAPRAYRARRYSLQ